MKRQIVSISAILMLALLGAGCSKTNAVKNVPPQPTPKIQPVPPVVLDPHDEVRNAVMKFQNAKSFRANVTVNSTSDVLKAKLEFMKPGRFRGTVDLGKNGAAEIIVVNDDLFMKVNDQAWKKLSSTNGAKTIGETLRNALNGDANLDSLGLDAKVTITKTWNAESKCDAFVTKLKTADGNISDVTVCVADGYPKFLDVTTPQGPVHLEYYDYNTVFLIEKPI